ncbi:hypothetical protein GCM10027030_30230 [Luteococcus sediminum]
MSPDPTLKAVVAARRSVLQAQDRLDAAVAAARIAGASWAAIGEATGMTRQSAHERWGHVGCKGQVQADCECHAWGSEGCLCIQGQARSRRMVRGSGASAKATQGSSSR